jgi:hypothetical protein
MPGKKKPGPASRTPKFMRRFAKQGGSKDKAAGIANAAAARGRSSVGKKGASPAI